MTTKQERLHKVYEHIRWKYNIHTQQEFAETIDVTRSALSIARHTFATYMLSKNAPLAVLAKMMGHTNTVQTQRYAKVLAQSVFEEFTRIEKQKKKQ